ncbi:Pifo [Columba guinea]|nr:Pifo [Columba guinea]
MAADAEQVGMEVFAHSGPENLVSCEACNRLEGVKPEHFSSQLFSQQELNNNVHFKGASSDTPQMTALETCEQACPHLPTDQEIILGANTWIPGKRSPPRGFITLVESPSPGLTDAQKRISFGSCQERKIFPAHQASDRLGIQLTAAGGNASLGPGCYLSQEKSSLRYSLGNRPLSNKGYVIGARTAQRFMPQPQKFHLLQPVSPGPATYQPFGKKRCQPAHAPFSAKTPRFPDKPSDKELIPG